MEIQCFEWLNESTNVTFYCLNRKFDFFLKKKGSRSFICGSIFRVMDMHHWVHIVDWIVIELFVNCFNLVQIGSFRAGSTSDNYDYIEKYLLF